MPAFHVMWGQKAQRRLIPADVMLGLWQVLLAPAGSNCPPSFVPVPPRLHARLGVLISREAEEYASHFKSIQFFTKEYSVSSNAFHYY